MKAYAGFIGRQGASFDALHASGIHFKSVVAQDVDVCLMMAGQEDGLAASFLLKKKRSLLHRAVVIQAVKRFVRQKNRGIFHDNAIEGGMRLPASSPSRCVRLAFSKVWDILCQYNAELVITVSAFPFKRAAVGKAALPDKQSAQDERSSTRFCPSDMLAALQAYVSPHLVHRRRCR